MPTIIARQEPANRFRYNGESHLKTFGLRPLRLPPEKRRIAIVYGVLSDRPNPTRGIFKPGAVKPTLRAVSGKNGIRTEEACTLVLLRTDQFSPSADGRSGDLSDCLGRDGWFEASFTLPLPPRSVTLLLEVFV
ncbi:MAG: hypothetical protein DRP71_16880 [Verrucomicrobia bacterium]|nr:MAG: hypothetical protein DRP71_16880 [Verrucomicrobiota bacterium]